MYFSAEMHSMFFINKKFSILLLSLILLICSNSTECKPRQQFSSTFFKVSDVILCTAAIFLGYEGFQKITAPIGNGCVLPSQTKLGMLYCVAASMTISCLCLKWKSEIDEKIE